MRCQNCKKNRKQAEMREVELRESFDKRDAIWSAPKRICLDCLEKKPIAGNYRIAGLNVDWAAIANRKIRLRRVSTELTTRQKTVLDYVIKSIEEYHRPPSIREICKVLHMNLTRSARDTVNALIRKGYLVRDRRMSRGLRLSQGMYVVKVVKKLSRQ